MSSRKERWRFGRQTNAILVVGLAAIAAQANDLPYIPTRIFFATQQNLSFVYVIDPPSSGSPSGQLRSIAATSSFAASSPTSKVLSSSLPFLENTGGLAFTSSLDPSGALNVLVGDCSAGANGASLWVYRPSIQDRNVQGSWSQQSIDSKTISGPASQVGVNYLASSVSFAATSAKNASIYTFAGMCPYQNSTDGDWTSAAAYSNQLLILDHDQASEYDFEIGSGRGQPISEAGFSITPLKPTFSTAEDGTQASSQNFLLLGGHTADAFINMSQVALFSLPQASWTFLPVTDDTAKTDLRTRQVQSQTEPRSGHSAVLSADGSKVIMFGGWVGDVSTPAEPQLAILNVGAGYGGVGGWSWTISPVQPSLPAGVSGVYGHGATMLDGNIMMVMGGWTIPTQAAKRRVRRAATPVSNNQNLLYNVSSGSWVQDYVPPPKPSASSSGDQGGLLSTKPQKVGLGVGLTLGILAIVIAAVVGWLVSKRFKKQLRAREEELREKEIDELHQFDTQYDPTAGWYSNDGPYQRPTNIWDGRSRSGSYGEPNIWRNDSVREAERSGLDLDIPSPHRGLRRSMAGRQLHSGRGFDERRVSRGSGVIHPIAETEEEENNQPRIVAPSEPLEDPFRDPEPTKNDENASGVVQSQKATPVGAATPGELTPGEEKSQDAALRTREWAASVVNPLHSSGRISPEKSDRTGSNLSDHSVVSQITARTHNSSNDSTSRSVSTPSPDHRTPKGFPRRSLRILPAVLNPFSATRSSPSSPTRSRHSVTPTSQPPLTADSFTTAPATFDTLQLESDALLGPARPGQAGFKLRASPSHTADTAFNTYSPDNEPTFMLGHRTDAHKAPTGKVGSWVGSVRRAVANAGRSASLTSSATGVRARAMAQAGPSGGLIVYDTNARAEDSAASSPTKKGGLSSEAFPAGEREGMKRSASEGATSFLVRRQGAGDWGWDDACEQHAVAGTKERRRSLASGPRPAWGGAEDLTRGTDGSVNADGDDEWDVERAVESRNVQVMFSVPKERLRVVNADVDAVSVGSSRRSVSGGYGRDAEDGGVGRDEADGGLVRVRSRRVKSSD